MHVGNPVERIFWGRLPLASATSTFYFQKATVIQQLVHEMKYKNNKEIGIYLGQLMGRAIVNSNRFMDIDALIPLPLFADKERKRGYNQAQLLCEGVASILKLPVITNNVIRKHFTETQTRKGRRERWENVAESFFIKDPDALGGKHLMIVDDVVTTGATLEACGTIILKQANCRLSLSTLAIATI
jgi:ComF family protein